jgi:hypothetical protein
LERKMNRLFNLLSAVLAFSILAAILVLALTPAPVEAGPPSLSWIAVTNVLEDITFPATRKGAKGFCGVTIPEVTNVSAFIGHEGEKIEHIYKADAHHPHDICK